MTAYEHTVQFVPRGVPPHRASDARTISFVSDTLDKQRICQQAHQHAAQQDILSPYALRNHWDIGAMSVEFANAPWGSPHELGESILTFPGVVDYGRNQHDLTEESHLFVAVKPRRRGEFIAAAENYYPLLAPEPQRHHIVQLTLTPQYTD